MRNNQESFTSYNPEESEGYDLRYSETRVVISRDGCRLPFNFVAFPEKRSLSWNQERKDGQILALDQTVLSSSCLTV